MSKKEFDKGSDQAERRLGMASLEAHYAAHPTPYIAAGMQEIGMRMHHAASAFAIEAQNQQ